MSRFMICDVCDNSFELTHSAAVVQLPSEWIPGADMDQEVLLDVCSTACLAAMAIRLDQGLVPGDNQEEVVTVDGVAPDHGDDEVVPRFAPEEPPHTDSGFLSPVKVRSKGER